MSVDINISFPPQTRGGAYAMFSPPNPILLSDIFSGIPQHYPGSTIRCQEILTLSLSVYDESIVDQDLAWYSPKKFLGNYRLLEDILLPTFYPEDSGYIENLTLKIRRYSEYTVTANPSVPIALGEDSIIDNCNFQLKSDSFFFGGLLLTGSTLTNNQAVFKSQESLTKVDLEDTLFNRRLKGIGFFLRPGVEALTARYQASVINEVRILSAPFPNPTCSIGVASCSSQFELFIDNPANAAYLSQSVCQSQNGVQCLLGTFTCPSDETQTFNYYYPVFT
jgi:hypothetical protein